MFLAIASGTNFDLALLNNGTVVAWGANGQNQTNVPSGLSNVVAIAAGGSHALALQATGLVTAWGSSTNVPAGLSNVMAIAAGDNHSLALKNDGTVVVWGDNSQGQTNMPVALSSVKLVAAGGNHSLAGIFSTWIQYPVNVANDLLLIYNTNSTDSATVLELLPAKTARGHECECVGYQLHAKRELRNHLTFRLHKRHPFAGGQLADGKPDKTAAIRRPISRYSFASQYEYRI